MYIPLPSSVTAARRIPELSLVIPRHDNEGADVSVQITPPSSVIVKIQVLWYTTITSTTTNLF